MIIMEFWIGLVVVSCICIALIDLVPISMRKTIPYIYLFLLWFIMGFRYMIGWDYQSYMNLFYYVNWGDLYPEITFIALAVILRDFGFNYQALFVLYSMLLFFFLYIAIKNYTKSSRIFLFALILFFLTPILFWNSLSVIRQSVSVMIFFWASKYIISRELIKYLLAIAFASLWHLSALPLIFCYWICHRKFTIKKHILFVISMLFFYKFNIFQAILISLIDYLGTYSNYLNDVSAGFSSGFTAIFSLLLYVLILMFKKNDDLEGNMFLNMYALSIMCIIIFNFSGAIYRMRMYFEIFYTILLPSTIVVINQRYRTKIFYLLFIPIAIMFLANVNSHHYSIDGILHPFMSSNNIEFQFNFNIFE